MSNITNNSTPPADFKVYLETLKGAFSSSDAKEFAKFCADYERLSADRLKFANEEAEKLIREISRKAEDDPSPENIDALKKCSPVEIRSRFENTANGIGQSQQQLLKRAKPIVARLGESALAIVQAQIEKVEAEARERSAKYGVPFVPALT